MAERIDLRREKETLLMALYLRACDSKARHPILGDPMPWVWSDVLTTILIGLPTCAATLR